MVNVVPVNDSKEHILDTECPCHPLIDENILIHHAWDCRESQERQGIETDKNWKIINVVST